MWGREGNSETSPQRQAQFNEISRRERMSPYKEREHRQLRSLKRGGAPLGLIDQPPCGRAPPDFTQELPRKLLPTRTKETKGDAVRSSNLRGVVCGALAPLLIWDS